MSNLLFAIALLVLALIGVVMRKTYFYLPVKELKRKAEKGDKIAAQLYRAAAYQNSLRALLWLYIGLMSAGSLILFARELPIWASILIAAPLLWIAFSLIPATRLTKVGTKITSTFTPPVAGALNYLHPLLSRSSDVIEKRYTKAKHTRLYEREDILDLIEQQQGQPDNRITEEELEIVKHALGFADHKVRDVLTPRKHVKIVLANDTIGPVLIDEIHKTGQNYALVKETKNGPFIGSISHIKLGIQSSGSVEECMDSTVYYVHENDILSDALHAFFVTNHPVFIVVNSFEEYLGIITVENILHQLLGHLPGDDFDQYADIQAVAARHPRTKKSKAPEETPVKTGE